MNVETSDRDTDEGLLTQKEAADYLRIGDRSVYALAKAGKLPKVKIGRSVRYDPADLREFVETCKSAV